MTSTVPIPQGIPLQRVQPFDPPTDLTALRDERPVSRMIYPDGHEGWLVTGYDAARAVLADVRFSSRRELIRSPISLDVPPQRLEPAPPGAMIVTDPPEHTRYRRLLMGQFTVRRMNQLTPRIQQITDDHLAAMRKEGPPADLVRSFALPIPSLVICELLGVPYETRDEFQRESAVLFDLHIKAEQRQAAATKLERFLQDLVEHKRAEPGDDLLGGLVTGSDLTDEELTNIGLLLLIAGHETTANMLALGTFALLQHPEQMAALRSEPELAVNAVEELLRYLSIIHIGPMRAATEDVEIEGELIRAGESVTVSVPGANWDSARFPEPEQLDITRRATGHLSFGHGVHQCLGQQLARVEMRIAYPALLREFPTLGLAVPAREVPLRTDMAIYGVHRLPVTW
ncbi:cytochrome P450 [Micromonospora polyrhachis]|uniref:Cytochrome P450 n=1 Tax=Micromonospora polyrhachis TaxID=1282883 RepID=A0A7W7SL77_9ACTN|nr:cytochrome P450 [Micromonospora polyrhachis]MBB4956830.1 cytochrome P450 [Micromonospora polyrhachis]